MAESKFLFLLVSLSSQLLLNLYCSGIRALTPSAGSGSSKGLEQLLEKWKTKRMALDSQKQDSNINKANTSKCEFQK